MNDALHTISSIADDLENSDPQTTAQLRAAVEVIRTEHTTTLMRLQEMSTLAEGTRYDRKSMARTIGHLQAGLLCAMIDMGWRRIEEAVPTDACDATLPVDNFERGDWRKTAFAVDKSGWCVCTVCGQRATWDEVAGMWIWPCNCVGQPPTDACDATFYREGSE